MKVVFHTGVGVDPPWPHYAMIGLLRVHTLLGDYSTAIKCIDAIDFTKRVQLFSKVVACHITLFYYTGFVFMMLRRYATQWPVPDSPPLVQHILCFINPSGGFGDLASGQT